MFNFRDLSSILREKKKKKAVLIFALTKLLTMLEMTGYILQGSNHLFRSDPRRFREKFQQLEGMGERCKPSIGRLGPKCYPNART